MSTFSIVFYRALARLFHWVSYLPLGVLYGISDVLYFLFYWVFRYRVSVVRQNMEAAFPEMTRSQLRQTERAFFRHLADVIVETIKLRTLSKEELKKRCRYTEQSTQLLNRLYEEGRSIVIIMAHTGNWEWAGASWPLWQKHQILTAYRPLRNPVIDQYMLKTRKRTGNFLAPMKILPREMLGLRKKVTATALIGDQNPPQQNAFWVSFLNQQTPFFKGCEILSQKFDYPVLWGQVKKTGRRGYYDIDIQMITEQPRSFTREGDLTQLHVSFLERDIREQPENWLWSHRRWKHKLTSDLDAETDNSGF